MRRVLIAIDGSKNALKSVAYTANLYQGNSDLEVTLLHIHPAIPSIFVEEQQDPLIRKDFEAWKLRREEKAKWFMDEASKVLQKAGLKAEQILERHHPKNIGTARDIVWEADKEGYDAMVLGKRGLSKIEEFFLGSITNEVLEISVNHPVWVVDGDVTSKRVLIAMDETDQAIELARHAGKMLRDIEGVDILLYHRCTLFTEIMIEEDKEELRVIGKRYVERQKKEISRLFKEAEKVLVNSGIDQKAIDTQFHFDVSFTDKEVSKDLLLNLKQREFGTIVMGRKGSTNAREFRMGSVCQRTLRKAKNCALWIL